MRDAMWLDLSDVQADGLACVVCARDHCALVPGRLTVSMPVGRSRTRSQVMACDDPCYPIAARLVEQAAAVASFDPTLPAVVTAEARRAVVRR